LLKATYTRDVISGSVVFIDHFGNLITNITRELFDSVGKGRPFGIFVRGSRKFEITGISTEYSTIGNRQPYLAIFNSFGVLEIAQLNDNFAQLENCDITSSVEIKFTEDSSRLFY
jgi:S-adenosylmethionine hydrolase